MLVYEDEGDKERRLIPSGLTNSFHIQCVPKVPS